MRAATEATIRSWLAAAAVALLSTRGAAAADQVVYGPAPSWVRAIPTPAATEAKAPSATQILLWSTQARHTPDAVERYVETAVRIATAEGLAGAGGLAQTWDPQIETLSVHKLEIIRDGRAIDALADGRKLIVVRRETNLEAATLDGRLTATLQLEGLRVGDVVHVAVTMRRSEPVLGGYAGDAVTLPRRSAVTHLFDRETWPQTLPVRWRAGDGLPKPVVTTKGGETELVYDLRDVSLPDAPAGAPTRFQDVGLLQLSAEPDWDRVSARMAPLYAKASRLAATSPLQAQIAQIRAHSRTPEERALAALRLVQDQIRYVFIGLNFGDFTPADADATWSRRYGDCKGKTALLLALLNGLGIEAQAVLVNTADGDALPKRLPWAHAFDHVLVRATIGGKPYWLDGTRIGDRRLSDLPVPFVRFALPVADAGARLEEVQTPPAAEPLSERRLTLDLSGAEPQAGVPVHAEQLYRGDTAVLVNANYAATPAANRERDERSFWSDAYSWISVSSVAFRYDELSRVAVMSMEGRANPPWSKSGRVWDLGLSDSSLGWDASFARADGAVHADAPWAVGYPAYQAAHLEIALPEAASGFTLLNADAIDRSLAGVRLRRLSRIAAGRAVIDVSTQSLAPEFPASETREATAALYQMSTHDVVLRWNRAPGASLPSVADDGAPPASATEFAARGARRLAQDPAAAAEDFDAAARLDPREPKYVYNRGVAHAQAGRQEEALKDFDAALKVDPGFGLARLARGQLLLARGRREAAAADFEAALADAKGRDFALRRIARIQQRAGDLSEADRRLGQWLAENPKSDDRADVLAARCEVRTQQGRDKEAALQACGEALAINPRREDALVNRGTVRLQQARWAEAEADFALVLARSADNAPALYGRGLAEVRQARTEKGRADIRAAQAISPDVAAAFEKAGLKAP